jgi:hypothetical protein
MRFLNSHRHAHHLDITGTSYSVYCPPLLAASPKDMNERPGVSIQMAAQIMTANAMRPMRSLGFLFEH